MVYSDDLASMTGRVRQAKPNAPPSQIRNQINDRIRYILDQQIFWADLLANGLLAMPAAYITGSITLTNGSATVTGSATAWPTNDVSNTTIPGGIPETGILRVTPSSMTGIATDSFLYVDGAGTPETVAVLSTTPTTFTARFQYRHNANCTATQSSLSGLQMKLSSMSPIFTVRGVASATSLDLDLQWGGDTISGQAYQILKIYFTIAPDIKDIITLWDPAQGRPLGFHKSQDYLNYTDPQRQATGVPQLLADFIPSEAGSMRYELWPHQTITYQIPVLYCRQWPEMKNPTDKPPSFINPSFLVDGATADALRIRNQEIGSEAADPFFDPRTADIYEKKFQAGLQAAIGANESKALNALQPYRNWFGSLPGGSWNQSHLSDDYWSGSW